MLPCFSVGWRGAGGEGEPGVVEQRGSECKGVLPLRVCLSICLCLSKDVSASLSLTYTQTHTHTHTHTHTPVPLSVEIQVERQTCVRSRTYTHTHANTHTHTHTHTSQTTPHLSSRDRVSLLTSSPGGAGVEHLSHNRLVHTHTTHTHAHQSSSLSDFPIGRETCVGSRSHKHTNTHTHTHTHTHTPGPSLSGLSVGAPGGETYMLGAGPVAWLKTHHQCSQGDFIPRYIHSQTSPTLNTCFDARLTNLGCHAETECILRWRKTLHEAFSHWVTRGQILGWRQKFHLWIQS